MQRRHHYERAFEDYLRARRIPYVAVDEARKALLPSGVMLDPAGPESGSLKSFDFVVYGQNANLLIDIKGRRVPRPKSASHDELRVGRLESWVTEDDIASLTRWQQLFGPGFESVFVFVYWCDAQPPDALFQEVFEHKDEWYALRSVRLCEYVRAMKPRSPRWRTVHVPTAAFERISQPFVAQPAPVGSFDTLFGPVSHPAVHALLRDAGPIEPALEPLESRRDPVR
jgi:hypothetical protein